MKTQTKKRAVRVIPRRDTSNKTAATQNKAAEKQDTEASNFIEVAINKITFSPLNYRKYFDPKSLEDFSEVIKVHGIISPVTLRPVKDGYELVAGERRVRAAKIAGLKNIPAVVKTLSDEEVKEIQLSENINREDPHPLHEAQAIADMLQNGKTIEEAAHRLGKSKQFIYNRMKLATLIESFHMAFLADKMTIQQAIDIAKLPAEAQQEIFDDYFTQWEDEDFEADELEYVVNRYHCDLRHAPFNIKDKKLLPDIGACTTCPFNSATLKSLFPELAKEAVCSNKSCYRNKCKTHLENQLEAVIKEHQPEAILSYGTLSDDIQEALSKVQIEELPLCSLYDITIVNEPEIPDVLDYTITDADEEKELVDQESYQAALQEYEADKEEYEAQVNSGQLKKGLRISNREMTIVYFNPERKSDLYNTIVSKTVTAKEVQEAIKAGTVTTELLQGEIARLKAREAQARQRDAEKIQLQIHEQFSAACGDEANEGNWEPTKADRTAVRLFVYQNLGHYERRQVTKLLFSLQGLKADDNNLFELLSAMGEQEFCYLIRKVVIGKSESKNPTDILGYTLYRVAESAGVNVAAIEQAQNEKASEREEKLSGRVRELERKIEKMNQSLEIVTE